MSRPLTRRAWASLAAGMAGGALGLGAAHASAPPAARPAEGASRLEAAQAATVGLTARAVEGAGSVTTLGRVREGSGVAIAAPGGQVLVLTVGYLVLEADQVELVTRDLRQVPGQVVAQDFVNGLALVRPLVPLPGVRPVALGAAGQLAKGEPLLYVSGATPRQAGAVRLMDRRSFTGYWEYHLESALYTAPLVPQHSGAALFNVQGELVGIGHLAMRDVLPDDDPQQVPGNMFVPVDVLRAVIEPLVRDGRHPQARRPWLGITSVEMQGQVRITRVTPDSPAQAAGVRVGHWVVAVEGQPVTSLEALYKRVWTRPLESGPLRLTVREGSTERELQVPLRERGEVVARPRSI